MDLSVKTGNTCFEGEYHLSSSKHADKVADNWDREWKREQKEKGPSEGAAAGLLSRLKGLAGGSALTRKCSSILRDESGGGVRGVRLLEAGCGTSNIAVVLAGEGAHCCQFDISWAALEISKEVFDKRAMEGRLTQGDLFKMPFKDKSFDIVWNVGVLEHLTEDLQDLALKEMIRVCKDSGKVVTLNPYARGYIYRAGKWLAERFGRWSIGYEVPIYTLRPNVERIDRRLAVEEYSFGFLLQLLVFKHLIRGFKPLLYAYAAFYELINLVLSPLNRLPGFLLVTVIRRKAG